MNCLLHIEVFSVEWYKTCLEALERYQKEIVEQEDVKWNNARKKHIEKLKPILEEIAKRDRDEQGAVNGDRNLLIWLYKT